MKSGQYYPARIENHFNKMVESIFDREIGSFFGSDNFTSQPPVNILETVDGYSIEIAAPGLVKEDFEIQAEGSFLTVSTRRKQEGELHQEGKILRKEFNFETFSRRFRLTNGINMEKISARYENGVLKIALLKSEAELKQSRSVEIL